MTDEEELAYERGYQVGYDDAIRENAESLLNDAAALLRRAREVLIEGTAQWDSYLLDHINEFLKGVE